MMTERSSSSCCPLHACSALLLLPSSADGDADTLLLNFNWKGKLLPGSPLNQYIFGLMVLIEKPWKRVIRILETLAGTACLSALQEQILLKQWCLR